MLALQTHFIPQMPNTIHKVKASFSIVDESFVQDNSKDYSLYLEIGFDVFSFCILDSVRNKFIVLKMFPIQKAYNDVVLCEKVHEIFEQNELLKSSYKNISASFVNNKYTLMPAPLFEKEKAYTYLSFNHTVEESETVSSDYIKNIDTYVVFSIPKAIADLLNKLFPQVQVHHFVSPLIESVISQYKNQSKRKVFVHVQSSHFEVIVTEGKKLVFFNTFQHQTSEDFIYYLLFVCEQLHLNPEELELVLIGEIEKNSALYQILFKYIRNISFGSRNENNEYSYKFDTIPSHFYYSLLSQSLANN